MNPGGAGSLLGSVMCEPSGRSSGTSSALSYAVAARIVDRGSDELRDQRDGPVLVTLPLITPNSLPHELEDTE